MSEYLSYVTLGFSILFGVFILFGFLWGIIRGLKKTAGRGIFLLVTSIILIFVAVPITSLILKIKINCNISTESMELVGSYNVAEILTAYIKSLIGDDFITKYPDFASIIVNFGIMLVNSIVYLVLFWFLKWLLLPLNSLFTKLVFKPYKYEIVENEKTGKKKKKKVKVKKHRLLGGLVGIAVGLVVTFNTMLPIWGMLDIANTVNTLKIENMGEEPTNVDELTDGVITDITDAYRTSAMGFATKYTGLEYLGLLGFDGVTTAKLDNEKVTLRTEVKSIVSTIQNIDNLMGKYNTYIENNFETITQAELDALIAETRIAVNKCKEVKIVDCMADYMLPLVCSYVLKTDKELTSNPTVDALIKETLKVLIERSGINVIDELDRLIDIADYTSTQGLLIKVIKGDTSKPLELLDGLEDDFAKTLMNKVFALQTVDTTLTHIFNIGLTYFDQIANFGYEEGDLTKETVTAGLTNLVDDTFKLAKSLDDSTSLYFTFDSIKPLGKLLNTIKSSGLITTDTYNNIVKFACEKLKKMASDMVPTEFNDVFNNQIVEGFKVISNWETEMNAISEVIDILRDKESGFIGEVTEGSTLRQGNSIHFTLDEATLINLGKALDKLEETTLFGANISQTLTDETSKNENEEESKTAKTTNESYDGTTVTKLIASICSYINNNILEDNTTLSGYKDVISSIRENTITAKHSHANNANFFENEMKDISPLIIKLGNIIKSGNVDLDDSLGTALDKAKHSTLLGNDTTVIMIEKTLDIVSDAMLGSEYQYNSDATTQTLNDKIYELFEGVKTSLNDCDFMQEDFWKNEMTSYIALKNIAEESGNVSTTSGILEIADDLDTVRQSKTIPAKELNGVIAFTVRQLKTGDTSGINATINELIEDIADAIEKEEFNDAKKDYTDYWKIELKHIDNLKTTKFDKIDTEDDYYNIGLALDKVLMGYTTLENGTIELGETANGTYTRKSYLISRTSIQNVISGAISEMTDTIKGNFDDLTIQNAISKALSSISQNAKTKEVTKYSVELVNLFKLSDIKITNSVFENLTELKALGKAFDEIAYNKNEDKTAYDASKNSVLITRNVIGTLIADVIPMAKSSETAKIDSTIDAIVKNVTTVTTADTLISWETELEPINSLMGLKGKSISLNDIKMENESLQNDGTFTDTQLAGNELIKIANTLDEIAFKNDGSTYSNENSLIITRENLKDLVKGFLEEHKTTSEQISSEDEIMNDIIDNTTGKINTGNEISADKFSTFKASFTELLNTNKQIENMKSDFGSNVTFSDITTEKASELDNSLAKWKETKICGAETTQKIANLLLSNVEESLIYTISGVTADTFKTTEIGKYITALETYYNTTASSISYVDSTSTDKTKLTTDGNAKSDSNAYIFTNAFERIVNAYKSTYEQVSA